MFRPRSIGLLLALITLLLYLPATSFNFINYDDPDYVTNNPIVQSGLTWEGVKWAFAGAHASNWHPLTWLSHMADSELFLSNPAGPHLVNILIHSLNAALVFALLYRLTKNLYPCLFIAALFAVHPLRVESVAWISERKDVLSTFFSLLCLLSYVRYVQESCRRSYWLTLFFFVLALLSKPMPVTLPLIMLLLDDWPLNRLKNGLSQIGPILREKWPLFITAGIFCGITVVAQRHTVSSFVTDPLSLRVNNAVTAYVKYLYKIFWPTHLAIYYPLYAKISLRSVFTSSIILTYISFLALQKHRKHPWFFVGWLWFLISLLPVIGLVQVGSQSMADRYSYFPSIGILIVVAFAGLNLITRFNFLQKWIVGGSIVIFITCCILMERQLQYWRNSEVLFRHTLEVEKSATAHLSLGIALNDQNKLPEALTQYLLTLQLDPHSVAAMDDIAKLLDDEGKPETAILFCRQATKVKPQSAFAHINLAIMLGKLKQFKDATNELAIAAQLEPVSANPLFLMGQFLLESGCDDQALYYFDEALHREPNDIQMLVFISSVLAGDQKPQIRNGLRAYILAKKAVDLTKNKHPVALDALAMACAEEGQFDDAMNFEKQAINIMQITGPKEDIPLLKQRLNLYENHQAWRKSFLKN